MIFKKKFKPCSKIRHPRTTQTNQTTQTVQLQHSKSQNKAPPTCCLFSWRKKVTSSFGEWGGGGGAGVELSPFWWCCCLGGRSFGGTTLFSPSREGERGISHAPPSLPPGPPFTVPRSQRQLFHVSFTLDSSLEEGEIGFRWSLFVGMRGFCRKAW